MTEKEIQYKLFQWRNVQGHELIVPNCQVFGWDADLISVSKAGLTTEHEIKCSVADFRSEIKGSLLRNRRRSSKYWKHYVLSGNTKVIGPNYFTFVVPVGLLTSEDILSIPDHAGLIYYMPGVIKRLAFEIIIRPYRLHTTILTPAQRHKIARSLEYRYWSQIGKKLGDWHL